MAADSSAKSPTTTAKSRYWDAVLQAAEARLQEPYLFVGDWTVGGASDRCAEHFAKLLP
jgi:hypothetical protein